MGENVGYKYNKLGKILLLNKKAKGSIWQLIYMHGWAGRFYGLIGFLNKYQ